MADVSAILTSLNAAYSSLVSKYADSITNAHASYNVDGQQVDHAAYMESLLKQMRDLEDRLAALGDETFAPFEIQSRALY